MSKSKIKNIAFDIGGVVMEGGWGKDFLANASEVLNIDQTNLRKLMDVHEPALMRGKIDDIKFWRNILRDAEEEKLITKGKEISNEKLKKLWVELFEKCFQPRREILDLINELRNKGFEVGCISNSIPPHTKHNVAIGMYDKEGAKPNKLEGYFHPVFISDRVGKTKFEKETGSEIFQDYLMEAGCKPEEVIFIDDEERNLKAPKKLHINTIFYENTDNCREDILKFYEKMEKELGIKLEVKEKILQRENKERNFWQRIKIK